MKRLLLFCLLLLCARSTSANFLDDVIDFFFGGFGGGSDSIERPPPAPSGPGPGESGKPTIVPAEYEYDVQSADYGPPVIPILAPEPPEPVAQPILIPVPVLLPPPPSPSPVVPSPPPSPVQAQSPPPPTEKDYEETVSPAETATPPANTIFVPDAEDVQGSSENFAQGDGASSRTTTIIIAVACSVGGIVVLSCLFIFCWYCRARRRGVADSSHGLEAGARANVRSRSRADVTQRPSKRSYKGSKMNCSSDKAVWEPQRARAGESVHTATSDILKHGASWKPRSVSNGHVYDQPPNATFGPMAAAAAAAAVSAGGSLAHAVPGRQEARSVVRDEGISARSEGTSPIITHIKNEPLHTEKSRESNSTLTDCLIDFSSIQICECIGQGSFGKVYRSVWNETSVAVKFLTSWECGPSISGTHADIEKQDSKAVMTMLETEADILASLRHPNIVQFMGICSEPPCLVSEYCQKGSLCGLLRSRSGTGESFLPTWDLCLKMMIDAATGILYLHSRSNPIVHCDLKSSNILVDADYRIKICDFNLSKLLEGSTGSSLGSAHNPRWLAPETLGGEGYSKESDVYAFGIIMWEMLTRSTPWADLKQWDIVTLVQDGARPPVPNFWDVHDGVGKEFTSFDDYVALMTRCWSQNPYDRPAFAEIVRELKEMSLFVGSGPHHSHSTSSPAAHGDSDPASLSISSTKVHTSC